MLILQKFQILPSFFQSGKVVQINRAQLQQATGSPLLIFAAPAMWQELGPKRGDLPWTYGQLK